MLLFLIFLVIEYKKLVGGYISFKETFTVSIGITVLVHFYPLFSNFVIQFYRS